MIESLGVESVAKSQQGLWQIRLLKDDESTVELQADCIISRTEPIEEPLGQTLLTGHQHASAYVRSTLQNDNLASQVVTAEPGYFRLRADKGIPEGLKQLRKIFAILGGRADLDLYEIMQKSRSQQ
ncbi:MAG: hypothetical protein ACKOAH_07370, partial [Pirellula sp.]